MGRVRVGVGVDGHRRDAHLAAGLDHADRDLAAVGDQDLAEHAGPYSSIQTSSACAFRGRRPCLPGLRRSSAGRRSSPRCSAWPRSKLMPGTRVRSSFALARASGPEETAEDATSSTFRSSSAGSTSDVDQADLERPPGVEPLAGEKILPRPAFARPAEDIGGDARRDEADLHLAQAEPGVRRGDDDVAGRDEARAAADGRPVHPGDRSAWAGSRARWSHSASSSDSARFCS